MIYIVWSDHDETQIEEFGEGLDGTAKAEAKLLDLHSQASDPENYVTIDMVIRGVEVEHMVTSTIKIERKLL
jgi:hypothetical protein